MASDAEKSHWEIISYYLKNVSIHKSLDPTLSFPDVFERHSLAYVFQNIYIQIQKLNCLK